MNSFDGSDQAYRSLSFWHDSMPGSLQARASLQADIKAEIVIVGAGYTGLWTAYYLKKLNRDLDIVILEAEIAGFGASGRNGGWCSGFLSNIERWIDDPQHREAGIRLQKLMFETIADIGEVAQRESIDCHFDHSGVLEVAANPAQMVQLREELDYANSLGFEANYQWLTAAEAAEQLNIDAVLGGLHMSHCAAIHPARLVRGLAETVERMGVRVFEKSPVVGWKDQRMETLEGAVTAQTNLIATEGYTGTLPGLNRRLIPLHSTMVVTEPLNETQLRAINFSRRYTFGNLDKIVTYGQVTADRRIAFGCRGIYRYGSKIQSRFDAGDAGFEYVRQTLLRFFPALEGIRFTHAWGGCMGVSRKLSPSVNYNAKTRRGWADGFFGNGVASTHLAGRTLADLVLKRDTDRVHTPWVNPPDDKRKWEPEPLRWLAINSRAKLMAQIDRAEYKTGRTPYLRSKIVDHILS